MSPECEFVLVKVTDALHITKPDGHSSLSYFIWPLTSINHSDTSFLFTSLSFLGLETLLSPGQPLALQAPDCSLSVCSAFST